MHGVAEYTGAQNMYCYCEVVEVEELFMKNNLMGAIEIVEIITGHNY